jgi:hypothetical protein
MLYSLSADALLIAHLIFIVFVVLGGILVWRWHRLAWFHIPTAIWGAAVELAGWPCPLTSLEMRMRHAAGEVSFEGGFVEHYVQPIVYPVGLTRDTQLWFGLIVIALNIAIYAWLCRRAARRADLRIATPKSALSSNKRHN